MDFLERTRDGYDAAATQFAALFENRLDGKPIERATLVAFAEFVRATGNPTVADVGCGTGVTTRILRDLGLAPTGIDLSPNMIVQARLRNPDLAFAVGSMTALNLPDDSAGGVCAWYSIIHVPDSHLSTAFSEFYRILTPGGLALLSFQVGDQPHRLSDAFGVPVDIVFHRRTPSAVESVLAAAGIEVYSRTVREADDDGSESTPHAFLIARKPR